MARVIYLSHPQVAIDPAVPVPDWDLSPEGRARVEALTGSSWLTAVNLVVASNERKARTTAEILAPGTAGPMITRADMGENDRSATGFLPGPEFEATADAFFANPTTSIRGWERAVDAQARIVGALMAVLAQHRGGDLLCVGHGAVGTLLMSHCAGWPISRAHDQTGGGGNLFTLTLPDLRVRHAWHPMEHGPL